MCVAAFVDGGAIVKFADQVLPIFPHAAIAIGFCLSVIALMLAILVAYSTSADLKLKESKGFLGIVLLTVILRSNVFFVIAGAVAGFKGMTSQQFFHTHSARHARRLIEHARFGNTERLHTHLRFFGRHDASNYSWKAQGVAIDRSDSASLRSTTL